MITILAIATIACVVAGIAAIVWYGHDLLYWRRLTANLDEFRVTILLFYPDYYHIMWLLSLPGWDTKPRRRG